MEHIGFSLAQEVLRRLNAPAIERGDGEYTHRASGVSRCRRDAVLHALGEPWSDLPDPKWGEQLKFAQGHSGEADIVVPALERAGLFVYGYGYDGRCRMQLELDAVTPLGMKLASAHPDFCLLVPWGSGLPGEGHWFLADCKTITGYGYVGLKDKPGVYDEVVSRPKPEHVEQISIYAGAAIADHPDNVALGFGDFIGQRFDKVNLADGYTFGGGLVVYLALDNPTRGRGDGKEYLSKLHMTQFDIDDMVAATALDRFDDVERHRQKGTMPSIAEVEGETWGGARCCSRWCKRWSVCTGRKQATQAEARRALARSN